MGSRIEVFVVHLARAKGRREQVEKLLVESPFQARILDAVDGTKVPVEQRASDISETPLFEPAYPFALNAGEYGCFQSHRVAWQTIVDEGLDAALILEDDVELTGDFAAAVALAVEQISTFGYVQFQVRAVDECNVVMRSEGTAIVQPRVTPLRTSAQLVSRGAAQSLLEMTAQIDRPVDTFLQSHWHTGMRVVCVVPSGVEDRSQETGGSTISSSKSVWGKFKREFLRNRYRNAVKRLS